MSDDEKRRERNRAYQAKRRAAGLAWDQRPENAERRRERQARWYREKYAVDPQFRENSAARARHSKDWRLIMDRLEPKEEL